MKNRKYIYAFEMIASLGKRCGKLELKIGDRIVEDYGRAKE